MNSPMPVGAIATCPNCHEPSDRSYCGTCGQFTGFQRFTTRGILRQTVEDAFNLDHGLAYTATALMTRPGVVVRDYIHGRTLPYTNPVRYVLIFAALAALATVNLAAFEQTFAIGMDAPNAEAGALMAELVVIMTRYFNLLLLFAIPWLALFSRLLFRGAGYNLAEHLIFNIYVYGQQNLIFLLMVPLVVMGGDFGIFSILYLLVVIGYYAFACVRFFETRTLSGTIRSLGASVLAYIVYYLLIAVAAIAWVVVKLG